MSWLYFLALFASKWEYSVISVKNDLRTRREDYVGDTICNSTINISPGEKGSLFNDEGGRENCSYYLQAPDGYVVELTVGMVTFGADTCSDKWLLVRDGASSQAHSVWEICSKHTESAKKELWRGRNMSIEYTNKAGSEGKWFQLDYTGVVDNFLPLLPPTTTETRVSGDNDCSDRRLKPDGDFELPYTAPEVEDNYVPIYKVTIEHDHRCTGGSQCEVNQCDNGGTCVTNGHKETCHCMKGYKGEFCREGGSFASNLEFEQRPQDRTVKRQNQAVAVCIVKPHINGDIVLLFKGEPIPEYRASTGYGDRRNGILEIKKFNEQNEGQYTCLARAGNLTVEHVFSMTMVNDCNLEGFRGPTKEEEIVGNTVFLTCSVLNAKEVLWKKDGEVIDLEKNTRMKHLSNNYLQISNLELEDEGDYSCEATDFENCGSEKTAHLTVFRLGAHSKYCGRSVHDQTREDRVTPYISKGEDAYLKEHPWHVTMLRVDHNGRLQPFCGATLISQNYLITAAHCIADYPGGKEKFTPENIKLNFASTRCFTSNVAKAFKRYIIHEEFNKTATYDSDIALIELDEPLEYSAYIRPVCLEDATYNNQRFLEGRRSSVSRGRVVGCGWLTSSRYGYFPDKLQVRGVGDLCPGDGGDGLLMEAVGEFRWVLTGIATFAVGGCDNPLFYSMFTNVGNFYDWINDHTHFTKEQVDTSFLDEFQK
ncbi:THRB-like protein [Mya arenaria]|uniref:THRB-like protein n=1 Tax=Mya arenaria TaxID=6604 RepID=A0ABY7FWZ5_MYAAR|nr:THRB-like protein [Mya arenaria]